MQGGYGKDVEKMSKGSGLIRKKTQIFAYMQKKQYLCRRKGYDNRLADTGSVKKR
jgi:hypothetical protein